MRERLLRFYEDYQRPDFDQAIRILVEFYKLPTPRIEFYDRLNGGRSLGLTDSDGTISLVHPSSWVRMKPTDYFKPTASMWIHTVLHEVYHWVNWVDDEAKANAFARKFFTGLQS